MYPGRGKVFATTLAIVASAVSVFASPVSASIEVGQIGAPTGTCEAGFEHLVKTVSSGNSFRIPEVGTITSWSHLAIGNPSQILTMKVYRPLAGDNFMVVGHDSRLIDPGVLNTFPASLAVFPGDFLGLYSDTENSGCLFSGLEGNALYLHPGALSDGQAATSTTTTLTDARTNISAILDPSNSFTFTGVTRDKRRGTAILDLDVPNSGELTGTGKGVSAASAASISKSVQAGATTLKIKTKGKKKTKLKDTGNVKVTVNVTYTPIGGDPKTQRQKITLKKKL
jgi:hypothetical protein